MLFAWLTVTSILVRASMALYHVPHLALGAELSSDYQERTAVVGYRLLFAVLGSVAAGDRRLAHLFPPDSRVQQRPAESQRRTRASA